MGGAVQRRAVAREANLREQVIVVTFCLLFITRCLQLGLLPIHSPGAVDMRLRNTCYPMHLCPAGSSRSESALVNKASTKLVFFMEERFRG